MGTKLLPFDTSEPTRKRKGPLLKQVTIDPMMDALMRFIALWCAYGIQWTLGNNALVHKAHTTRRSAGYVGMRFPVHPSTSPCLNSIEHVWNQLKREGASPNPRSLPQDFMNAAARVVLDKIPKSTLIDRCGISCSTWLSAIIAFSYSPESIRS